jgi:regulator of nucleoside diphosphate kinase
VAISRDGSARASRAAGRCTSTNAQNEITIMNHTPIYISRDDYSKLRLLIATALHSNASAALAKLRDELDRAAVIDPTVIPVDVVTMNSTVAFEDLGTSEVEEYTITFPEKADVEQHRISILAPIGTALIGCRVGDIVKWATPGGVRQLKVRRVTAPAADATAPTVFARSATA